MNVRHDIWVLAFVLVPAFAAPVRANSFSFNTRIDDDKRLLTAADIHMEFTRDSRDGDASVVTERRDQTVTLKGPGSGPLKVRASENGGIRVQPSADGTFSAVVCMAAGAKSSEAAKALLDRLRIVTENGSLTVTGPDDGDWAAYLVLSVPPKVSLDLSASNGDTGVRDVSGEFTARSSNGPLSFSAVTGKVDAQASNGPIHFKGHAGDVRLTASNGPIDVELDDVSWSGAGLDAHADNGPVKLSAPEGLRAGVQVTGSQNSPFKWSGGTHSALLEEWDRTHTVRLGSGPVLIRLSTVNGPVEIRAPRAAGGGTRI